MVDYVRCDDFSIAFFSMFIQHKVVDSTFQTSTEAFIEEEASACYLTTAFPVKDTKVFTEIPVSFRFEVKLAWSTPTANFHIVVFVSPNRNAVSWDIWKSRCKFCQFSIDFCQFSIQGFNLSR
ncbi:Uncharacterised protein [Streptococcus pneumoniae]|nr:Uncharacterised protein [Streptococcus pneumoniae]CJG71137.1 Uncharacterised protein [Streptococcus pneumoniae]CJG78032.1 Uncharacterised protein [Streptococcus pneumoniae]COG96848.1 Uncharacterised protein [Streptococcus pneumoniae]